MILDATGRPIGGVPLDKAQTVALMVAELSACPDPLILGPLTPLEALQLAGVVQLAARHPELSAAHRDIAAAVVDTVRAYFAGRPTLLDVLNAGDDPAQDVPRPNPFHAHLDVCAQCRDNPFDLCATGAAALRATVDASDRP